MSQARRPKRSPQALISADRPVRAKKKLGQNFLHEATVIDRITQAINPQPSDRILEIGPGMGALTTPLLRAVNALDVVEFDRDMVALLKQKFAADQLCIHHQNALKFSMSELGTDQPLRLVGNLPYNIASPLMFHFLDQDHEILDFHVMVQKEMADRMVAKVGDRAYGRMSITLAVRCQVDYLFTVRSGAFNPPPKVDSAFVRLVPNKKKQSLPYSFDELLKRAFAQRRKRLRNALKNFVSDDCFSRAEIDPQKRAEELAADDYIRLANVLGEIRQEPSE